MIYAIQSSGFLKIGTTEQTIERRIAALQTGSPEPLIIAGVGPGGAQEEAAIHRELATFRVRGEWFRDVAAVRAALVRNGVALRLEGSEQPPSVAPTSALLHYTELRRSAYP